MLKQSLALFTCCRGRTSSYMGLQRERLYDKIDKRKDDLNVKG